jgi:DNA ligase-4
MLDSSQTTESQRSAALGDNYVPARHLALVFYDVLLLDGQSLVFDTYEQRRAVLESLIRPVEGYVRVASDSPAAATDDRGCS